MFDILNKNGEGSGEFISAAVVGKVMPQTGMIGIIVDNRTANVLRKKVWVHVC